VKRGKPCKLCGAVNCQMECEENTGPIGMHGRKKTILTWPEIMEQVEKNMKDQGREGAHGKRW
jgi:hypothetical protein